jgi:hypothetical protein
MKTTWCTIALTVLNVKVCRSATAPTPIVSQLHVLSIHVKDHATFDTVFRLCRDVLKLPRVYGELSKPGDPNQRLYAGFSVGNAYLEPCGPYPDDAPFSLEQPARFHGLTFSPATTIADAAEALEERSIPHSGVLAGGQLPYFVYVQDPLLTGQRLALSLWEIQNTNDAANLQFLRSALDQAKGGSLGVQRLDEVRIGFPDKAILDQWRKLLAPASGEGDVWFLGQGPALHFVPGNDTQPMSIVLRVESLKRAKDALNGNNLSFEAIADQIELGTAGTSGLRIILREM